MLKHCFNGVKLLGRSGQNFPNPPSFPLEDPHPKSLSHQGRGTLKKRKALTPPRPPWELSILQKSRTETLPGIWASDCPIARSIETLRTASGSPETTPNPFQGGN
jgi:hypothetical protein